MKRHTPKLVGCLFFSGLLGSSWGATEAEWEARFAALEKELKKTQSELKQLASERSAPSANAPARNQNTQPATVMPWETPGALDASFGGGGVSWSDKTSLGGYGELHLNLGDKEQIDFHRWVLFLSHQFTEGVTLFSELEVEHSLAGDGKPGEVELEQAYIDFAFGQNTNLKVGQMLLPVGILNEVHEPDTFFGVERNNVEKNILPTTWWEGGVAVQQRFESGFTLDAMVHSGLSVETDPMESNAFRIRSGRQKVAEADASEWAATVRGRYQGVPGLDLTAFVQYQSDLSPMDKENNSALLTGGTVDYQRGGFGFRGLIAHWDIDGDSFKTADADSQWGYFVEPSYTWRLPNTNSARIGVFGRYSHYEYGNVTLRDTDEYTLGLNFWPVDNVVLKTDVTLVEEDGKEDNETYNFGVGYSF